MSWTKTPPTKEGYYFWRMFPKDCYSILEIIKEDGILKFCDSDGEFLIAGLGGEWWDSPVPEPMDSQKIKLELAGDVDNFVGNTLSRKSKGQLKFYIEQWKPRGE